MPEIESKHWQERLEEDGFVSEEEQEKRLDVLWTYNDKFTKLLDEPQNLDSAQNYILIPNVKIIKEYNVTFFELMMNHSHKYNTKRMIPIQIIRSLIDVAAALQAYIDSPNKKSFVEKYHNEKEYAKIDGKSITHYVRILNESYPLVLDLYNECCKYVHTCYYKAKSSSIWHYPTKPGRFGFLGKYYKVKYEDFENEIREGFINDNELPFDYEEEVDIINYCIKVNEMLLKLVEKVKLNDYA